MLRVAAVASIICDDFGKPLDKKLVISTCLLHDIGNVIKFDFNSKVFPDSWFAPQGKRYWMEIQKEFIEKYSHRRSD